MNDLILAAISDIHGNRDALAAVLADVDRRGITNIVNLGDSFYGPLDPAGTADLLLHRKIPAVSGNEDREILDSGVRPNDNPTLNFTRNALQKEHFQWLAALPKTRIEFNKCCLCHGTPTRDNLYLLYDVKPDGLLHRDSEGTMNLLPGIASDMIVLCGHSHLPGKLQCKGGPLVVDVGSVGLPAFTDNTPYDHQVSAGSPHARYSILSITSQGYEIEQVELEYDWETAAALAEKHNRPDWAAWLQTGTC
jgi:predicted phosphodiesterase